MIIGILVNAKDVNGMKANTEKEGIAKQIRRGIKQKKELNKYKK